MIKAPLLSPVSIKDAQWIFEQMYLMGYSFNGYVNPLESFNQIKIGYDIPNRIWFSFNINNRWSLHLDKPKGIWDMVNSAGHYIACVKRIKNGV